MVVLKKSSAEYCCGETDVVTLFDSVASEGIAAEMSNENSRYTMFFMMPLGSVYYRFGV